MTDTPLLTKDELGELLRDAWTRLNEIGKQTSPEVKAELDKAKLNVIRAGIVASEKSVE
jgi:hypothetical protein